MQQQCGDYKNKFSIFNATMDSRFISLANVPKPFWKTVNDWKSIIENVFCADYSEKPGNVTVFSTFVVLAIIGLAINLSRYNSLSPY